MQSGGGDRLWAVLKEQSLGWVESVLVRGAGVGERARGRYAEVVRVLSGEEAAGVVCVACVSCVVCPWCAEDFAEHAEWFCQERHVVAVSYWRLDSVAESSVKVDDLGANFLGQVLAKFKTKEAFWGRFPEGGVRVLLGDTSRFVLTELDAGVSLKQMRARGGVHVCGGMV